MATATVNNLLNFVFIMFIISTLLKNSFSMLSQDVVYFKKSRPQKLLCEVALHNLRTFSTHLVGIIIMSEDILRYQMTSKPFSFDCSFLKDFFAAKDSGFPGVFCLFFILLPGRCSLSLELGVLFCQIPPCYCSHSHKAGSSEYDSDVTYEISHLALQKLLDSFFSCFAELCKTCCIMNSHL